MIDRDELLKKINEMPIDELQALICKALDDSGIAYNKGGDGIPLSDLLKIDPMYELKPYMLMREKLKDVETILETEEGWRTAKLKPCPFCGSKAVIEQHEEWDWAQFEVGCSRCNCKLSAYNTATNAVMAWNRRASNERIR